MGKKSKGGKGKGERGQGPIGLAEAFFTMKRSQRRSRANQNKMDYGKLEHALKGENRPGQNSGNGYHWRPGGKDFDGRRIVPGTEQPIGGKGVYQADPEYYDGTMPMDRRWKPKGGNGGTSTFFPKDWSAQDVDSNISTAFRKSRPDPNNPNMWIGDSGGVRITGYYDNNAKHGYTHGFPSANQP